MKKQKDPKQKHLPLIKKPNSSGFHLARVGGWQPIKLASKTGEIFVFPLTKIDGSHLPGFLLLPHCL